MVAPSRRPVARTRAEWLRPVLRAAAIFAAWTLYAVVFAYVAWGTRRNMDVEQVPYVELFLYKLPEAWIWALLTWPILAAARRLPVTSATWARVLPLHLVFALAAHAIYVAAIYQAHPYVRRGGPRLEWPEGLWSGLLFDVFVYAAIVGTAQAIEAHAQALRLRNDLLESELRMLRMQLQPHFLFNTLHGVAELVHRDPASAERALMRLADLLRWTLQSSAAREVTVREELAALETYLEIQRLRHGPGVVMKVEADADTMGLGMPGLLLQPLVENALRHGVRSTDVAGVHVRVRRDGDRLVLAVTDDGRGLAPGFRVGTGLRATRARLAGLYGADQQFEIGGADGRGTRVSIVIPARAIAAGATQGTAGAPNGRGAAR